MTFKTHKLLTSSLLVAFVSVPFALAEDTTQIVTKVEKTVVTKTPADITTAHQALMQAAHSEHATAVESMKSVHQGVIDSLNAKINAAKAVGNQKLVESLSSQKRQANKDHNAEMNTAKTAHTAKMVEMKTQHLAELSEVGVQAGSPHQANAEKRQAQKTSTKKTGNTANNAAIKNTKKK